MWDVVVLEPDHQGILTMGWHDGAGVGPGTVQNSGDVDSLACGDLVAAAESVHPATIQRTGQTRRAVDARVERDGDDHCDSLVDP